MDESTIMQSLNSHQRSAVGAVRGPVCILAGAGSGKTTAITRRIANQVRERAFPATAILAVTFTDKAASEMRARLAVLDAGPVRTQTFHSAALAQLHALAVESPGQILSSKAAPLRQIANTLPKPYRFRPAADLATEIEWAKNRRLTPPRYLESLGDHEPPIPADLMVGVWHTYESRKEARGYVDFEDLLELAIRMYDADEFASERFQARYASFTVDEYQDVNLLQQSLLERWLGQRDDLCVVGDDYQSIYSFTGASARYLLEMPQRYSNTTVVRLEDNYRSSPEILDLANRLVPHLSGAPKRLRSVRPPATAPSLSPFADPDTANRFVVDQLRSLHVQEGIAYEEMAVLYRVNWRSEDYEELLTDAGIPFRVADGAFLARQAARRLMPKLKRSRALDVAVQVRRVAQGEGWTGGATEGLGERESTRQNDLGRLVRLAEEFDDGARSVADFAEEMEARFSPQGAAWGVNLLTYHRAKGLEFDAVMLPRLEEGELPFKRARTDEAIAEERRLLYVGMTRAKRYLSLSWVASGKQHPSRFLAELGVTAGAPARGRPAGSADRDAVDDSSELRALKRWRSARAKADAVPAFVVFHDSTLADIASNRPRNARELARISGVGPTKLERYGSDILETLAGTGAKAAP
ncbi:MAG: ATP-dependent DNA helicase UvrD2 [Actinomycetota bacterium]|nr:ATP-dependent DNA helicase UvrD2 [Actinomycetota bacterium]